MSSDGSRETQRHWLVPIGLHAYAHFEPRWTTFWIGPELSYALHIDQRHETAPSGDRTERATRSGLLAGFGSGVELPLSQTTWFGFSFGESLSFAAHRTLPNRTTGSKLSAMSRLGLSFRASF